MTIEIKNLVFSYPNQHKLLDIPNLHLQKGESLYIAGPSGSGKTTLLNIMIGLINVDQDKLKILNQDFNLLTAKEKDRFRGDHFGIIFQLFNLINFLSVEENIYLPLQFSELKKKRHNDQPQLILKIIEKLGIKPLLQRKAIHLSLGEQQRVAVARALIGHPEIIIADEPTSALDEENKDQFIQILNELCHELETTLIFVSHDTTLKKHFNQILDLKAKQ